MMTEIMGWEEQLWDELDELSLLEQFTTTGNWINQISRELLVELARKRREVVLAILVLPDWDATRLAEETGTRRGAIIRLAEEGRADARARLRQQKVA
jgi:hypothetical protein